MVASPEDAVNAPERLQNAEASALRQRTPLILAASLAIWGFISLPSSWWPGIVLLGFAGLIYPIRFLPGGRRLKDWSVVKTGLIAACWIGGGVVLPALLGSTESPTVSNGMPMEIGTSAGVILWTALYRLAYIVPNLLFVDWLDAKGDREFGTEGLGARMGPSGIRQASMASILLAAVCGWMMMEQGIPLALIMIDVVGLLGLGATVWTGLSNSTVRAVHVDLWAGFPIVTWLVVEIGLL